MHDKACGGQGSAKYEGSQRGTVLRSKAALGNEQAMPNVASDPVGGHLPGWMNEEME